MKTIAVLGFGLLGASFGLALQGKGFRRICCTRNADCRAWALEHDAADEVSENPAEVIPQADIAFMALPLPVIMRYLTEYASLWRPGSIVTDMGSVKGVVMDTAERTVVPRGVQFIGGHPMAGTEYSGHRHAFPTLFRKADVFLCPASNTSPDALDELESIWRSVDTNVIRLNAAEHDNLVAHTSHVQHIVASALTLAILGSSDPREKMLRDAGCASGFRDTSRIASSNPQMWKEIISLNTPAILNALGSFEHQLAEMHRIIEANDFDEFERRFAYGKQLRDAWLAHNGKFGPAK